jgi:hypothetical protein
MPPFVELLKIQQQQINPPNEAIVAARHIILSLSEHSESPHHNHPATELVLLLVRSWYPIAVLHWYTTLSVLLFHTNYSSSGNMASGTPSIARRKGARSSKYGGAGGPSNALGIHSRQTILMLLALALALLVSMTQAVGYYVYFVSWPIILN